jgi:hypothetical protein
MLPSPKKYGVDDKVRQVGMPVLRVIHPWEENDHKMPKRIQHLRRDFTVAKGAIPAFQARYAGPPIHDGDGSWEATQRTRCSTIQSVLGRQKPLRPRRGGLYFGYAQESTLTIMAPLAGIGVQLEEMKKGAYKRVKLWRGICSGRGDKPAPTFATAGLDLPPGDAVGAGLVSPALPKGRNLRGGLLI